MRNATKNGHLAATLTAFVVWALVRFVPAFRTGIPTDLAVLIPAVCAIAAHTLVGLWSRLVPADVAAVLAEVERVLAAQYAAKPAEPSAAVTEPHGPILPPPPPAA